MCFLEHCVMPSQDLAKPIMLIYLFKCFVTYFSREVATKTTSWSLELNFLVEIDHITADRKLKHERFYYVI